MFAWVENIVRSELQQFWQQRVQPAIHVLCGGMVYWSRVVVPSEGQNDRDPLVDDVEGFDVEGQEQNPDGTDSGRPIERAQLDARRAELAGFAITPLKEEPTLGLGWGANLAHIPIGSKKYRPKGLKAGEPCVYNLHSSQGVIKIRVESGKEGQIEITAPAGRDVVVNGGTKKVAREGDPVGWLVWTTTVVMGSTVVASIAWSPTDPGPVVPPKFSQALHITGGVDHFLG